MLALIISTIENSDDRNFVFELYIQYYPIMKKKAYEISWDYSIVDDLINDAFIKLIDKISLLRVLECCKRTSYIVYTIKNISIDYIRKRAAKSEKMFLGMSDDLIDSIPDAKLTVEEICSAKEDYEELGKAIEQLSERDRDLLYYKYNLELRDKEIANIMDLPVNNIREYLTRPRRRALKVLAKEENEHAI
jgi:RNA polymerase sigma-70 factor (ECF subfamily)